MVRALFEDEILPKHQRNSLLLLSELLYKHYGKKVIILIDEYDVPPGYLRVSKESIFTGLNNFNVHTIADAAYDEYFGFTDDEVRMLLRNYGLEDQYQTVKEWYDGYQFGRENVYCPWDVICYTKDHIADPAAEPLMYWANSSENSIIKSMIEHASSTTREQIETLISCGTIETELVHEMTYNDLQTQDADERLSYLWSILYATGYLTDAKRTSRGLHKLVIPNLEIQQIFEKQIRTWFNRLVKRDVGKLHDFCMALKNGNASEVETRFNEYLRQSISIRDTYTRKYLKENFYHGVLLGLFSSEASWIVKSNSESGDGYSDILIQIPAENTACIIEVKYAENKNFDDACSRVLKQVDEVNYTGGLQLDGIEVVHVYGIACWSKHCRVAYRKLEL